MARLNIDTGTLGNPATGDTLRTAMTKINTNFEELYLSLLQSDDQGGIITTSITNGDIRVQPNGAGIIELDKLKVTDDDITSLVTNGTVAITGNGTGGVQIEDINFNGTVISSDSSSLIQINEDLNVTGVITGDGSGLTNIGAGSVTVDPITFVGDDSTGTAVNTGETFKFAGTQNITTAVSGDTLTITGPDLSAYATQAYVDARDIGDLSVTGSTISAPSNADLTLTTSGTGNVAVASPFVLTSLTTTERDALTAVNGMMIYNTTSNQIEAYENGAWVSLRGDTADAG